MQYRETVESVASYALGARTLLVLDADPAVAPAIQRALGNAWRVFAVRDAQAALSFLAGISADVIVVDGDALAASSLLCERDPRLAFAPVIGIAKPLSPDAVRAAVAAVVAR